MRQVRVKLGQRHNLCAVGASQAPNNKTGNVYIFVVSNIQSFTSQILGVVSPLGENLIVFRDLHEIERNSDHKSPVLRALKRCLNEKDLIHDRVRATISKFINSAQIFETKLSKNLSSLVTRLSILPAPPIISVRLPRSLKFCATQLQRLDLSCTGCHNYFAVPFPIIYIDQRHKNVVQYQNRSRNW